MGTSTVSSIDACMGKNAYFNHAGITARRLVCVGLKNEPMHGGGERANGYAACHSPSKWEGHPWPGCRPVSDTWRPYSYGQTKQRRGLNNVGLVNPEDCYLSRKDSGMQGRDIQVVKPYKCGWRGPAGRLPNVWNGHFTGPLVRLVSPKVEQYEDTGD